MGGFLYFYQSAQNTQALLITTFPVVIFLIVIYSSKCRIDLNIVRHIVTMMTIDGAAPPFSPQLKPRCS